ncbi:fatty acid-binding protein, liver-like [Bombina bombina]|uniref:fatty acid-binding protein, liver-like n=1 Tax=Bombina bombina TaxID=8345 RepID=UPI00235AA973|nr:fatty acid-binding protein, liver-like [Bombina bombina]
MSMTGKYELVSHENFEPFMKAFGIQDDLIQKVLVAKIIYEIVQNGKDFKFKVTTGDNVLHNEFTIGKEAEIEILTGEKFKIVAQLEGGKLILQFKGIQTITELTGDILTIVMTKGDITGKRILKRI